MERRERILKRKKSMGRAASYSRISELAGTNVASIHQTLNGTESAIPINRERIMDEVEEALDVIEQERKLADAA